MKDDRFDTGADAPTGTASRRGLGPNPSAASIKRGYAVDGRRVDSIVAALKKAREAKTKRTT